MHTHAGSTLHNPVVTLTFDLFTSGPAMCTMFGIDSSFVLEREQTHTQ